MNNNLRQCLVVTVMILVFAVAVFQMASAEVEVPLWDKPTLSTVGVWQIDRATRSIRAIGHDWRKDDTGRQIGVASITFKLDGKAQELRGTVFVGDRAYDASAFLCKVLGDGDEIDTIGEIRKGGSPVDFNIPVRGISKVALVVEGEGNYDINFKNLRYSRATR